MEQKVKATIKSADKKVYKGNTSSVAWSAAACTQKFVYGMALRYS